MLVCWQTISTIVSGPLFNHQLPFLKPSLKENKSSIWIFRDFMCIIRKNAHFNMNIFHRLVPTNKYLTKRSNLSPFSRFYHGVSPNGLARCLQGKLDSSRLRERTWRIKTSLTDVGSWWCPVSGIGWWFWVCHLYAVYVHPRNLTWKLKSEVPGKGKSI